MAFIAVVIGFAVAVLLYLLVRNKDDRDDREQERFCKDWKNKHRKE